jgi:quercetin dioxygenase-like cupin family protein
MNVECWNEKAWGKLSEENMRRKLQSEGYIVVKYTYPPGTYFADHLHTYDKKDAVLKGKFKVCAMGTEFILSPGDMIHVPAHLLHSAEVVGDESVISLDASKLK